MSSVVTIDSHVTPILLSLFLITGPIYGQSNLLNLLFCPSRNKIYNNPQYYAIYVTKQIVGNLNLNGSVPAEQNHSSNVRFIGDVMLNSVCEHIKTLLEGNSNYATKKLILKQITL